MDPNVIAPLTANEFVQRILVPEVALHLIMEDKGFGDEDMTEALTILRDSSAYGVAMFPEDGGEWDGNKKQEENGKIGVGDRIVMERAKKRRKELEEEEREEKERRVVKEQSRPRPRPRPVAKGSSSMSILTPVKSGDERSIGRKSRGRSDCSGMDTDITSEADFNDNHQRTSTRRDRSLSASETKRQTPIRATRATSRTLTGLGLESDSDRSSKAAVGEHPPARSLPSRAVKGKGKRNSTQKIKSVSSSESDNAVEVVPSLDPTQTPVQKGRFRPGLVMDDEPTPKPLPIRRGLSSGASLPPLLRARQRGKTETGALTLATG
jgi:hypothetical protein